jgi:hypothetical protein
MTRISILLPLLVLAAVVSGDAREDYERRMFAIAAGPGVERLAQQYVDELRPCYEWEGLHDCPEEEAKFAEQYLSKNPKSPFREFLPLFAANRCCAQLPGTSWRNGLRKPLAHGAHARRRLPWRSRLRRC